MVPTSTDISITVKDAVPANIDAVVVFSTEGAIGADAAGALHDAERTGLARLAAGGAARGKAKEVVFDVVEISNGKFRRVYSLGLGQSGESDAAKSFFGRRVAEWCGRHWANIGWRAGGGDCAGYRKIVGDSNT